MNKEVKYIPLKGFKAIEDGPGGFEGYVTTFGELDDVGDIILQGAYTDTIPQFLKAGFNGDSHSWKFGELPGYPVGAREDAIGLYGMSRFHSTEPAQNARIVAQERMAAGLDVFTSIGYEPSSSPIYIAPQDYATEIPKYSAPALLEQNMAKAAGFSQVRVLPKVHLYEWSLVSVPALSSAMLTGVKSATTEGTDDGLGTGQSEETYLEQLGTAVKGLRERVEARIEMRVKEGRVLSSANWQALADMCDQIDELTANVRGMLESAKPKPKDGEEGGKGLLPDAARVELIRFLAMEARTLGVQIA